VLPASQPYRPHLKDMMERQVYPPRFAADGAAEPPYDVAGWTLPLQMGVRAVAIEGPFATDAEPVDRVEPPRGSIDGAGEPTEFILDTASDAVIPVLNALFREGIEARLLRFHVEPAPDPIAYQALEGKMAVAASPKARSVIERALESAAITITGRRGPLPKGLGQERIRPRRLGLYQPWVPSMDEGWTRLVLERAGFPYTTLHNADIRPGRLRERFDVILIPSITENVLRNGFARDATAPAYVGGLGAEGATALRDFAHEGGTIIGLEDSCNYLIRELSLPVKNVVAGLRTSEFYGPGSILRAETKGDDSIAWEVPTALSVYFDKSLAFEATLANVEIPATYSATNPLESGWLHGAGRIAGKAAVVRVPVRAGRVILFGFPPQHRGQTQGTFRLLFNAILRG
jgi:hypothetical protein